MLDFFTFFHAECITRTTYVDKLMVALMTILALGVVAVAVGVFCKRMWGGTILRSSGVKNYILLVYLVLPMMSSMAFSAFNCDEVSYEKGATQHYYSPTLQPPRIHASICHPAHSHIRPSAHTPSMITAIISSRS